jgi:activator of HSP90 ATPase
LQLKFGVIEQIVQFDATPEEVFDALLDPLKHSNFTGSRATTSRRAGARFTAWDGYISGKNTRFVKDKKIIQEWKTTEWPKGYPPSRLEITLTAKGSGTELKMVHSKVPAEQLEDYRKGWYDSYWNPLKRYFERASP